MHSDDARPDRVAVLCGVVAAAGALMAGAFPARAHDWYPVECCHATDCAPVDAVREVAAPEGGVPQLVVTSRHGTAIVPQNLPRQTSQDSRMHVCMRSLRGKMYVLCIFLPPSN
jgi:hypothetical protein